MTTNQPPQSDDHLAQRVIERIKGEHLTPRPRWEFIFKNYFFWTLGAITVALGAFAFSAALFEIENVDWRLSSATHADFLSFFLGVAPILWVMVLALFIVVGYLNVKRTDHGYRYPLSVIVIGAVLTSITLGVGLYTTGLGGALDESIGDHSPFYRPTLAVQRAWWAAPEKGLLSGQVVSVATSTGIFTLRDSANQTWKVSTSDLRRPDEVTVARGGVVRVVGVPTAATSTTFHACFVFPWVMRGRFSDDPTPPPLAAISPANGSTTAAERSALCKSIRPYKQLHDVDDSGE